VANWRQGLVLAWLIVPVAVVVTGSLLRPVLAPRFLIFSLPAVVLLAGRGFFMAHYRRAAAVALVLLLVLSLSSLRTYYRTPKEDWRGATQFVLSAARPGESIVLWDSPAFAYYRVRLRDGSNLDVQSPTAILAKLPELSSHRWVWLVLYEHDSWTDPGAAILASMRNQFPAEDKRVFGHDIWVLRYGVAQNSR
jgi:hypothetical protein